MLTFVSEAGFIADEQYADHAKRQQFVDSLTEKATAHAAEKGLMRCGPPLVTFARAAGPDPIQREVLILCVFEDLSRAPR